MNNFHKVINPGVIRGHDVFCKIEFANGKLSISGVIGPTRDGNAWGSCGQIDDELKHVEPEGGWTMEMIDRLYEVWQEWHLNDLQAACEHQRKLGWDKQAGNKVKLYHWTLKMPFILEQSKIKDTVMALAKKGVATTLPPEQVKVLALDYSLTTWTPEAPSDEYEPRKQSYPGDKAHVEEKMLNWLRPDEHPDGLLTRPCPVCGYKYGTAWLKKDVPEEVLEWLFNLPDTKIQPAWV